LPDLCLFHTDRTHGTGEEPVITMATGRHCQTSQSASGQLDIVMFHQPRSSGLFQIFQREFLTGFSPQKAIERSFRVFGQIE